MEIPKEFIETNGITPEQATAFSSYASDHIAELEKGWEGKANENAQAILNNVATKNAERTGIQRNDGEKHYDYITRSDAAYLDSQLSSKSASLEKATNDYNEKAKNVKGAEHIKADFEAQSLELNKYKE